MFVSYRQQKYVKNLLNHHFYALIIKHFQRKRIRNRFRNRLRLITFFR